MGHAQEELYDLMNLPENQDPQLQDTPIGYCFWRRHFLQDLKEGEILNNMYLTLGFFDRKDASHNTEVKNSSNQEIFTIVRDVCRDHQLQVHEDSTINALWISGWNSETAQMIEELYQQVLLEGQEQEEEEVRLDDYI